MSPLVNDYSERQRPRKTSAAILFLLFDSMASFIRLAKPGENAEEAV